MKLYLLPSLCVAVLLLGLAGCSYGPEKISTGHKAPPPRTREQVSEEAIAAINDFEKAIKGIKSAADAKAAIPEIKKYVAKMKPLIAEGASMEKSMSPEQLEQFQKKYAEKAVQSQTSLMAALKGLDRVPKVPAEFGKAFMDGMQEIAKAAVEAKDLPPQPPPQSQEAEPDNPPDSSGWAVWLLCVIVLAACVGFLSRDGLWSNAIQLVNVVFAGLLAMNFYEPLANFMTTYGDKPGAPGALHSYVSFFDFLALWICFVLFAVIFRAATDAVSRVRMRFLKIVDFYGGIVLSLCIGWVMVGITLVSLHAGPLAQYPLLGSFQPQNSMFLGMLAPDREWLGFTKYQSWGPFCRSVGEEQSEQCVFPPNSIDNRDFIEKHLTRRMHVEKYILGNKDHRILVNQEFMTPQKPN